MTFASPLPSVRLPQSALTPYVLEGAGRRADKAAFVDGVSGRTMTYGELEEAVRRQAGGWLERGLVKGDVVAVMAPNCAEYGVVFHAVALAGGVLTTVNPTYTPGEVHHQLVDSGATRLVTIPAFLETAKPGNVPMYEHLGFRVVEESDAPDGGPTIWFLRADPA